MENIQYVIDKVVKENQETVNDWLATKPRSWGYLAGKAVVAARLHYGRNLSDSERRIVWQTLWSKLTEIKSSR